MREEPEEEREREPRGGRIVGNKMKEGEEDEDRSDAKAHKSNSIRNLIRRIQRRKKKEEASDWYHKLRG